jgi:predicted  nucleic acid-binding Zn-ribbon protein
MAFKFKSLRSDFRRGELKMDERELLSLKKKIETSKSQVAELTGQRNYLMQELKETWGCKNVPEAEKLLVKMEKELDKMKTDLETAIANIKEQYDV